MEYFKYNKRYTNCLQVILSDLENCIDCLDLTETKSELRVRIKIDTSFLRICDNNGNEKVKKAVASIYTLVFSEEVESEEGQGESENVKIHRPFTYNCAATQMKQRIEKTLNEVVETL